jgi:hypothetical protein
MSKSLSIVVAVLIALAATQTRAQDQSSAQYTFSYATDDTGKVSLRVVVLTKGCTLQLHADSKHQFTGHDIECADETARQSVLSDVQAAGGANRLLEKIFNHFGLPKPD